MSTAALIFAAGLLRVTLGDSVMLSELGVSAEGRSRIRSSVTTELEATPRFGLLITSRGFELRVAYVPRLFVEETRSELDVLHRVALVGAYTRHRIWHASCAASGAYGTTDLLLARSGAVAGEAAQFVPSVTKLEYFAADVQVAIEGRLARRYRAFASVRGSIDGGFGASEALLPRQIVTRLTVGGAWEASRDTIGSELRLNFTQLPDGRRGSVFGLVGTWRHKLREGEVWTGIGPAFYENHEPGRTTRALGGMLDVGIQGSAAPAVNYSLLLNMTPQMDRFTAAINDRADVIGAVTWRPDRTWSVTGTGTGGLILAGQQSGQRLISASTHVGWASSGVEIVAGMRLWWQTGISGVVDGFHEWMPFVRVTYMRRDRL